MTRSVRLLGAEPDPIRRGWVRRAIRRLAREFVAPFVALMAHGHRFGRFLFKTEYVTRGGCHRRGACCEHVLLEWSTLFERHRWLGRIALWKLTRFYSFYDKGYTWEVQDGLMARVLGCHALRPDGLCGEYRLRPMFCRTYPEVPVFGRPVMLKGCGYTFVRRDRGADGGSDGGDDGGNEGDDVSEGTTPESVERSELVQLGGRRIR